MCLRSPALGSNHFSLASCWQDILHCPLLPGLSGTTPVWGEHSHYVQDHVAHHIVSTTQTPTLRVHAQGRGARSAGGPPVGYGPVDHLLSQGQSRSLQPLTNSNGSWELWVSQHVRLQTTTQSESPPDQLYSALVFPLAPSPHPASGPRIWAASPGRL